MQIGKKILAVVIQILGHSPKLFYDSIFEIYGKRLLRKAVLLSLSVGLYACRNAIRVFCINLDMYKSPFLMCYRE